MYMYTAYMSSVQVVYSMYILLQGHSHGSYHSEWDHRGNHSAEFTHPQRHTGGRPPRGLGGRKEREREREREREGERTRENAQTTILKKPDTAAKKKASGSPRSTSKLCSPPSPLVSRGLSLIPSDHV